MTPQGEALILKPQGGAVTGESQGGVVPRDSQGEAAPGKPQAGAAFVAWVKISVQIVNNSVSGSATAHLKTDTPLTKR